MNTKLLLIAASTLALAACGGSDVEVEETDASAAGTLLSEDQPPLEGDSPFVDGQDVADSTLDEESYDTGLDGPDLTDEGYGTDTVAGLDADPLGPDMDAGVDTSGFGTAADDLIAESDRIAAETRGDMDAVATDTRMAANDVASTVTDGTSAKRYTANNTDAYVAEDGELITGSEAALLSGTYEVALPNETGTKMLYITGEGDKAVGTFDGEPIEVMVTGRNFSFDAPVAMNGEESLMTFAGTFEDGVIDNGVLESQGDGATMTFTAVRTDADTDMDARGLLDDAANSGERLLNDTGDAIEGAYDGTTNAVGNAYDRATDGSDATNAFGTDRSMDMDDTDAMMDDESNVGIEDGVPSGIIRSGTIDIGEEPLDARGDTSTAADTGFGVGDDPVETDDLDTDMDDPNFDM